MKHPDAPTIVPGDVLILTSYVSIWHALSDNSMVHAPVLKDMTLSTTVSPTTMVLVLAVSSSDNLIMVVGGGTMGWMDGGWTCWHKVAFGRKSSGTSWSS